MHKQYTLVALQVSRAQQFCCYGKKSRTEHGAQSAPNIKFAILPYQATRRAVKGALHTILCAQCFMLTIALHILKILLDTKKTSKISELLGVTTEALLKVGAYDGRMGFDRPFNYSPVLVWYVTIFVVVVVRLSHLLLSLQLRHLHHPLQPTHLELYFDQAPFDFPLLLQSSTFDLGLDSTFNLLSSLSNLDLDLDLDLELTLT